MKTKKQKLIVLGILIFSYPFVIGGFTFSFLVRSLLWIYIPYLIYLFAFAKKSLIKKIILVMLSIVYGFVTLFFMLRFVLCAYRQTGIEYVNNTNKNLQIVGYDFSCYGTTGDLVCYKRYSFFEGFAVQFYYKTFTDYNNIDIDFKTWKSIKKH